MYSWAGLRYFECSLLRLHVKHACLVMPRSIRAHAGAALSERSAGAVCGCHFVTRSPVATNWLEVMTVFSAALCVVLIFFFFPPLVFLLNFLSWCLSQFSFSVRSEKQVLL